MIYLKYLPTVVLILLLPILIISPTYQLTIGFSVFALFSFFFMKEFNSIDKNELKDYIDNIEDVMENQINLLTTQLKENETKTKELNNSLAGLKMAKNMSQGLVR